MLCRFLQIKIAHSTRCAVTERFHGERVAYSVFVKELKAHYPDTVTNEYVGSALDALRREGSFNSSMDGRYSISAAEQRTIELKVQAIISVPDLGLGFLKGTLTRLEIILSLLYLLAYCGQ